MRILSFNRKADARYGNAREKISAITPDGQSTRARDLAQRHGGSEAARQAALEGHNSSILGSALQGIRSETSLQLDTLHQAASADSVEVATGVDGLLVTTLSEPQMVSEAEAESAVALQDHATGFGEAASAKAEADRRLRHHKANHGDLSRDAYLPNISRMMTLAFAVVAVEVLLGLALFADVTNGLLEAVIYSVLSTATTLAAGGLTGASARHAFNGPHAPSKMQRLKRGIAWVGVAAGSVLLAGSALLVGHYRDEVAAAAVSEAYVVPKLSMAHLAPWAWFDFQTLQGLLMTVVSMGCGIFAAWKAYSGFSDPVPGFTRVQKAFNSAKNELLRREEELRAMEKAIHERHLAVLQERLDQDAATIKTVRQAADRIAVIASQYRAATQDVLDTHNTAVRIHQEAYQQIRPDLPDYIATAYLSASAVAPLSIDPADLKVRAIEFQGIHEGNLDVAVRIRMRLVELRAKLSRRISAASQEAGKHDHGPSAYAATDILGDML
jgi:hypothetical protein